MKHEWEILNSTIADVCKYGWEPRRQCKHCKKIQQRYTETAWMRVTGYRWTPLVGRCPGPSGTPPKTPRKKKKK